jgi:hypothetical protein
MTRPGPLLWLRYAFGRALPPEYSTWVLHDTTCPTWLLRHAARFLLSLSPLIVAVIVFVPGPITLRLGCVAVGIAASVALSFGWVVEIADRRAEKAGYPSGQAERMRTQRGENAQREGAARRRAKIASRQASQ